MSRRGLSDQDILRLNDTIAPVVTITSHVDDDRYAPITTIAGTILLVVTATDWNGNTTRLM